jgi:leucyl aminopeptidase
MKINFARSNLPKSGVFVVLVEETAKLSGLAKKLDDRANGQLTRAIKAAAFEGKKEQTVDILAPGAGLDRVVLMGVGKVANLVPREIELLGGAIIGILQSLKAKIATIDATVLTSDEAAARLASGAKLRRL